MFALPTIWSLLISTIVFFIVAGYISRYLNEQGVGGVTRGVLVFSLAYLASWCVGEVIDWVQGEPPPSAPTAVEQAQPLLLQE
ncbi:MAG: hypothetical protein PHP70_01025 [Gallionella sp.]|nr:hypothetical protein [Gallionella sp.]